MSRFIYFLPIFLALSCGHAGLVQAAPASELDNEEWMQNFAEMQDLMNPAVDPCNDFHEYVCGNFMNKHAEKVHASGAWDILMEPDAIMQEKLKKELLELKPNDSRIDRQVKIFHQSCVNASIYNKELIDLLHYAMAPYGTMPAMVGYQWQTGDFNWQQVVARIKHDTGIGILLDIKILPDFTDTSVRRVALVQPKFEKINEIYVSMYLDPDSNETMQVVRELEEFGNAIANASQDMELTPPRELYAIVGIENMQSQYLPTLDTRRFINVSLGLDPSYVMIQPKYLNHLHKVIQQTPPRIIANYIFATFLKIITKDIPPGDWESDYICQQQILSSHFEKFLENMKYRKFLKPQVKQGILDIWHYLKPTLEETMASSESLAWMNPATRKLAYQKAKAMRLIADTHEDMDFEKDFQYLDFKGNDYIDNYKTILQWHGNQSRNKIYEKPEYRPPATVVPSFTPEENVVHIPVSALNPGVFWSPLYAGAYNFGRLGAIMSHEMMHGFEDVGRYFDAQGNSLDWLDDSSAKEFENRTQCLAKQYQNYVFDGRHLPQIVRQAENIADNAGLRLAYAAYLRWYEEATSARKEQEMKMAKDFSYKQLFFISYGQVWCDSLTSENYFDENFNEPPNIHLPKRFRSLGSLSNFGEFAKEFKCPMGSAMNPEKKCKMLY